MRARPTRLLAAGAAMLLLCGLVTALPAHAATARTTRTALTAGRAVAGAPTTLSATVTPTPTGGTVRFTVAGAALAGCTNVALHSGRATCRTTFSPAGSRRVLASYSGVTGKYAASGGTRTVTVAAPQFRGSTGACTASSGALVGVSFLPWGGPIAGGCSRSLSTGRALLAAAGFTTAEVQRFPAFICRIGSPLFGPNQYPTPAQDPCVTTPPSSAYWAFWTAAKGVNTWTYSPRSADADRPGDGSAEFWTFGPSSVEGSTGRPAVTPDQLRAGLATPSAPAVRRALRAAPPSPDAASAADYLVGQLVGGTHYEPFEPGTADLGLTVDAGLALAAAGTKDAALGALTDYVAAHQNEYTLLSGGLSAYASGGAVAKVALLAEATGRDPRAFGSVDLIAALRRLTCTAASAHCVAPGNYAETPSVLGQALGVLAQLRAGDAPGAGAPAALLRKQQRASGALPSQVGGSDLETDSTASAAMALALVPGTAAAASVRSALDWLASRQLAGGGFPGASGSSVNSAGLAVQALSLDATRYSRQIAAGRRFLAAAQNSDGGFDIAAGVDGSDVRASAQALGGVEGVPFASVLDDLFAKADAAKGANYLVSQLVDGNHFTTTFAGTAYDDQGLTVDGLLALLATGGHPDQVAAMVSYLRGQVQSYADVDGAFGGPYSGAAAKLAIAATASGADPTAFGGVDLPGVLLGHVCTAASTSQSGPCTAAGDFANSFSEISQALGVLALQASPRAADHLGFTSAPVVRLRQLQCADGGFTSVLITGNARCTSEVDATGFAVQALVLVPGSDAVLGKAQAYLEHVQKRSGLFSGAAADNANSTALGAGALQALVAALYAPTPVAPGPRAITPVPAWQRALTGLGTLATADGGYMLTDGAAAAGARQMRATGTPDLRASTQAVLAAAQRTLGALVGAGAKAAPRTAVIVDPGSPSSPPSSAPGGPGSSTPGSGGGSSPSSSAGPVAGGRPADTGVPSAQLLLWSLVLLVGGVALTVTGRRRVVGRHAVGRRH